MGLWLWGRDVRYSTDVLFLLSIKKKKVLEAHITKN